jgi:hypothetical protein
MDNGLLGALIGGGATCVVAYVTIRREERLAREQLRQSRFDPAYLALRLYINKWADHAQWNLNVVRLGNLTEPQLPQISDVELAQASLFATDDAVAATNEFGDVVQAYRLAIGSLEILRQSQSVSGTPDPGLPSAVKQINETATAVVASASNVHQLLRKELRGHK